MKPHLIAALLITFACIPTQAEEETLPPPVAELLRSKVTQEGEWGLVSSPKDPKKMALYIWLGNGPKKVGYFDLDLDPTRYHPEAEKLAYEDKKHRKMFPDLKAAPAGKGLAVIVFEQEHPVSVAEAEEVRIVQFHVHAQAMLLDVKTGKVLAESAKQFYRIAAFKKRPKPVKPDA